MGKLVNPFRPLEDVEPGMLFLALADARPTTIALVLSHLPHALAIELVGKLDRPIRARVLRCLADQEYCSREILADVAESITDRIRDIDQSDGCARAASILRECERAVESTLLRSLDREDLQLSRRIRKSLLTFDDIAWFSDQAIRTLLKNVPLNTWAVALQRSRGGIKERVTGSLQATSATKLHDQLDYFRLADDWEIEDARQQIVNVARELRAAQSLC